MPEDRRLRRFAVSYRVYPEDDPVFGAHDETAIIEVADGSFTAMLMDFREAWLDFCQGMYSTMVFLGVSEVFNNG